MLEGLEDPQSIKKSIDHRLIERYLYRYLLRVVSRLIHHTTGHRFANNDPGGHERLPLDKELHVSLYYAITATQ